MVPSKYVLVPPEELNPYVPLEKPSQINTADDDENIVDFSKNMYPDFCPWRHTREEDQILLNFIAKGYYTSSKVNFESISARSSLHESLPKLSEQLASQFSKVLRIREDEINRISANPKQSNEEFLNGHTNRISKESLASINPLAGPHFSLPSRVTLTDNKKEQWLQELSSPYASLPKISKHIPHGLRRKQVVEQCFIKMIPLKRAVWLIKCCYSIEAQGLKTKSTHSTSTANNISTTSNTEQSESQVLLKEWTDTFVFILENLIFDMTKCYNDPDKLKRWKSQISYFLKLFGNCYTLNLLDKEAFRHWLVEFVAKVENFEYLPLTLHILMMFWDDITGSDSNCNCEPISRQLYSNGHDGFLISRITDMLLNKYYIISNSKSMINDERYIVNDVKRNNKIKETILSILTSMITKLFQEQSLEIFLFPPASWDLYKPCLYDITNKLETSKYETKKKLELISYRNETLKNDSLLTVNKSQSENMGDTTASQAEVFQPLRNSNKKIIKILNSDSAFTNKLDDNRADFDWAQYIEQNPLQISQIIQLILWSTHPSRLSYYESNQLVAKIFLLQINSLEGFPEYEIEDTIWSLIFQIAKLDESSRLSCISLTALYSLLNILNTYGMIKVPTYIRKLISSGIMYLQDSDDKFFHCSLLINLKISPLMKNQYNMVLRNVMEYDATYYEKYNFAELQKLVDVGKMRLISRKSLGDVTNAPQSVRIMLAEIYLNYLCTGNTIELLDKSLLLRIYKVFCLELGVFHHFYKFVEFIVYHQLLSDIETMEALIDILIYYQKIFSQFINDHILFTKTFIFIYSNILKERDSQAYNVITFMPFWKFFMKTFSMALVIDNDLRIELSNIYEEEKLKQERLQQNKEFVQNLYNTMNSSSKDISLNFTELFQSNIKIMLSDSTIVEDKKRARTNLLLLINADARKYNKCMSIFLKRKNFKHENLVCLTSNKLLTFDQIKHTIGDDIVMELLMFKTKNPENVVYYNSHKDEYIRSNYEMILSYCINNANYYKLFLEIVNMYGPRTKFSCLTNNMIVKILRNSPGTSIQILTDILSYGEECIKQANENKDRKFGIDCDESVSDADDDDHTIEEPSIPESFCLLDFTNLWVFQAFTNFLVETIVHENTFEEQLKSLIFEIIISSDYNELCAQLFDQMNDIAIIQLIVRIMEQYFFHKCLEVGPIYEFKRENLVIIINLITSLSKKASMMTSSSLEISTDSLLLLKNIISHFNSMNETLLSNYELHLDVMMRILTIHQNSIFRQLFNMSKESESKQIMNSFVDNLFKLFETITFNLRLKLTIYEVLSSLKSYCIYASTSGTNELQNGPFADSMLLRSSSSSAFLSSKEKIPQKLMELPPFQVSSFVEDPVNHSEDKELKLGISTLEKRESNFQSANEKWFLYNNKQKSYTCKLSNESYHNINNYQPNPENSLNNSCFNLSLFGASFENKNPR